MIDYIVMILIISVIGLLYGAYKNEEQVERLDGEIRELKDNLNKLYGKYCDSCADTTKKLKNLGQG